MMKAMGDALPKSRFRKAGLASCAGAVVLLCGVDARAQQQPPNLAAAAPTAEVRAFAEAAVVEAERRQNVIVYPSTISGTSLSEAGLVAGDKDKRAYINYATRPGDLFDIVLSASTPLAEEGGSEVLQLNGLASKTRVGVQTNFGFHALPSPDENAAIFNKLWPECLRVLARATADLTDEERETRIRERGCNFSELDEALVESALKPYRRVSWFLTLKGDLGPEAFSFVDSPTFADAEVRKWSTSASLAAGALLPTNVYTSLAIRFEHVYTGAKNQAVCAAQAAGQTIACPLKVVGPPADARRGVIEGEIRRFLGSHAGVSWIVRYDWESGDKALEVPVYLVRDKEGGLRGGVAYGHVWSDNADLAGHSFSIFVGQTFGLTRQ